MITLRQTLKVACSFKKKERKVCGVGERQVEAVVSGSVCPY